MLVEDIARGESDQLEFKEVPNRDSSKWLKTVVAFANCRGGRIVFGVTNERKVVGIRGDIFAAKDAIADAVAHRNYVNGEESPITVALYDDRLEVTSPGKLPNGITVAKMLDGCSECRNKALAQALAYMNIIEDWGSGIPRICGDLKDAGFKGLEIIPWPNAVRIVIRRRKKDNTWLKSRRRDAKEGAKEGVVSCRILSVVEGSPMSARQIAETLGVRPTTRSFRLSLAALLDDGLLASTSGKGKRDKRQKYRMTEKGQKSLLSLRDEK